MKHFEYSDKFPEEIKDYWKSFLSNSPISIPFLFFNDAEGNSVSQMAFEPGSILQQKIKALSSEAGYKIADIYIALWVSLILRYANQEDAIIFSADPYIPYKVFIDKEATIDVVINSIAAQRKIWEQHPIADIDFLVESQDTGSKSIIKSGLIAVRENENIASSHTGLDPFDLLLEFNPDNITSFRIIYNNRLEEYFVSRMGQHLILLMEGVASNPDSVLLSVPILSTVEMNQVLFDFNRTDVNIRENVTLQQLFEEQVQRTPDGIAIVFKGMSMTYKELNERSNCLAHAIRSHYRHISNEDILPDELIGVCMERGIGIAVAMLGILKAGCAYVPLDPSYPTERLRYMMDDAEVRIVITENSLLEKLLFLYEKDYLIISMDGGWDLIKKFPVNNLEPISRPDNLAYIIYTSGSTGKPKGTMIENHNVVNLVYNEIKMYDLKPGHRRLQLSSVNFDAAVGDYYPVLLSGASLYICEEDVRKDPDVLAEFMQENAVNSVFFTPAMLRLLPRVDLPDLKNIGVGGEVSDPETLNYWSNGHKLNNDYGPTECTVFTSRVDYNESCLNTEIGFLINNYKGYVLDSFLNPVPVGVPGELYVGGAGICRGYLKHPELTKEKFILNPFVTEEEKSAGKNLRLYKSGDLVRWLKNGSLDFVGRADSQVKIRGFRIELSEIETVLSSHNAVRQCAVITFDENNEKHIAAYYVPVPGSAPAFTDLKSHLAEFLPNYMIPSVFIELEEMPLTPSKKIDHKLLPPPRIGLLCSRDNLSARYIPPRTPEEQLVSNVISTVMNLHEVSIDTDIFDIGAHSLIAARIASELRKRFFTHVEIKDVFEHPTILKLSSFLAEKAKDDKEEPAIIPRVIHREHIPLTFQQEQIWFLSKLVPNNRAYNFQITVRFTGHLDKLILAESLNEMIRRHEILRTTFHESKNGPVQVVHSPWKAVIREIDLTMLPEEKRADEAMKQVNHEIAESFDLTKIPLVRWNLYKLGDQDHIFFHMEHHFLHDGWEMAVFFTELKAIYTAFSAGKVSPLPELPIQYADYAIWQRKYLSGKCLENKVNYWSEKIRDYPLIINLPLDHPRPPVQRFNGGLIRVDMDRELYHGLEEFSHTHKSTLFCTMYSAFAVLLSKYCRQQKFLVGTGVANRNSKETEIQLGMFVNTVLLASDLTENPSFLELMHKTRENMLEDAQHYDTPFMYVVEKQNIRNSPGVNPIFQVLFAFHDNAVPLLNFDGLHGRFIEQHNSTAKTDINLICIPRAEQHAAEKESDRSKDDITLMWEYNTDLFNRTTMQGMVDHYLAMLKQFIRNPGLRVNDTEVLIPHEKEKILFSFNNNRVVYDRSQTIVSSFEEQVIKNPGRTAIIHNDRSLSYGELNRLANAYVHIIKKQFKDKFSTDLKPNTPIGISVDRNIDMMAGILAILKAGGAYVPLAPHFPESRLHFIIEDAGIDMVLTTSDIIDKIRSVAGNDRLILTLDNVDLSGIRAENPPLTANADSMAYIIYTSGTTGTPKGVCIPHRAVINYLITIQKEFLNENDVVLQISTYAFDASIFEFWATLLNGLTLNIVDKNMIENLSLLKTEMIKNNVSNAFFTTALFNAIVECDVEIITRMKTVTFGGEAVNPSVVRKLLACRPSNTKIFHIYGPTETTTYSTFCQLTDKYADEDIIPIGKPMYNYSTYILDEHGLPVAVGVPGELYIGGDSVAIGYLNRPELNKGKFIPNPFVSDEDRKAGINTKLYKTGDLVRWLPDGNIVFVGRTDFQVKIRGFRIEPEEIENALLKHPAVRQCVVIPWEQKFLVAYWVPQVENYEGTKDELKLFLARNLPEFMIPAIFIKMPEFKLNNNQKVDRNMLPPPNLDELLTGRSEYIAPRNHTEKVLSKIWTELLKIERISVKDSFFELGGNSLLTVRMLSGIKKTLSVEVNVAQMFAQPTIEALASFIDNAGLVKDHSENNLTLALADSETAIEVENIAAHKSVNPSAVLLTGITGFLGIYLLDALIDKTNADIYCLVRGKDKEDIHRRFEDTLVLHEKLHLKNNQRIKLLNGNLSEPKLGLDESVTEMLKENLDSIFHCGAMVHHMYDYGTLRKSNVLSTVELLKIAAGGKKKTFNYISTVSVATVRDKEGQLLEVDAAESPISTNGYALSKWVCEKILRNVKNMDINIFRPGNITGDSKKGICPPDKNHALLLLKGCIQMGVAPDWQRTMEMMPVDLLSDAILNLAYVSTGYNIFNMNNPHEMNWHDYVSVVRKCGFGLELLPFNIWREKHLMMADEKNAMYPIREFYLKERKDILTREWKLFSHWNSSEVEEKLKGLGIRYPEKYEDYVKLVILYLKKIAFLTN